MLIVYQTFIMCSGTSAIYLFLNFSVTFLSCTWSALVLGLGVSMTTYIVQLEVETTCIAHCLPILVPSPQCGGVGATIGTTCPSSSGSGLEKQEYLL